MKKELALIVKMVESNTESIEILKKEKQELKPKVARQARQLERMSKRNNLVITGLEDRNDETPQQLKEKIKSLFEDKLKVEFAAGWFITHTALEPTRRTKHAQHS